MMSRVGKLRAMNPIERGMKVPAVSPSALKSMRSTVRDLNIAQRTYLSLDDIAKKLNPLLRGWIGYYGRYASSQLEPMLRHVNLTIRRWAMRKCGAARGERIVSPTVRDAQQDIRWLRCWHD
jgi:Group II intron, maturase-specific domain